MALTIPNLPLPNLPVTDKYAHRNAVSSLDSDVKLIVN